MKLRGRVAIELARRTVRMMVMMLCLPDLARYKLIALSPVNAAIEERRAKYEA